MDMPIDTLIEIHVFAFTLFEIQISDGGVMPSIQLLQMHRHYCCSCDVRLSVCVCVWGLGARVCMHAHAYAYVNR